MAWYRRYNSAAEAFATKVTCGCVLVVVLVGGGIFAGLKWKRDGETLAAAQTELEKLEADLADCERRLESVTGGDPAKAPTKETDQIGAEVGKIRSRAFMLSMPDWFGGQKKKDLEERREKLRKRCLEVCEKYRVPEGYR